MVYYEKGLHNYLIPRHRKKQWPARHNGDLGVVQLNCTDRWEGSIGGILINLQRLSCILIGCIFYGMVYRTKLITSLIA